MSSASTPEIYPRCCFRLSPTFDNWCILRSVDIHRLKQHPGFEGQDFYFHNNLPLRWIRIVGVVVAIDEFYGRRVFTIDDSSGACIETITTYTPPKIEQAARVTTETSNVNLEGKKVLETQVTMAATKKADLPKISVPYEELDVGHVVDVKGRLTQFRDEMQIKIEKMTNLRSTEQEIALWERRAKFRRDVLDKPWTLTERQIRRCRKDAEPEEDNAARKRKLLKAAAERASRSSRKQAHRADKENRGISGDCGVD